MHKERITSIEHVYQCGIIISVFQVNYSNVKKKKTLIDKHLC